MNNIENMNNETNFRITFGIIVKFSNAKLVLEVIKKRESDKTFEYTYVEFFVFVGKFLHFNSIHITLNHMLSITVFEQAFEIANFSRNK